MRIPVDFFANKVIDVFQSPSEWSAVLAHARLSNSIGKENDAIFALNVEGGEADDAVLPALRTHLGFFYVQHAIGTDQQEWRITVFDDAGLARTGHIDDGESGITDLSHAADG